MAKLVPSVLLGLAVSGFLLCAAGAMDGVSYRVVRHYVENEGDESRQAVWDLACEGGHRRLSYSQGSETHLTRVDEDLETLSWSLEDPQADCFVGAVREDDTLVVTGTCRGREVDRRIPLDDRPWFQATSLSLRDFVLSDRKKVAFWTLRTDTLKAYKLEAVKAGGETLTVAGKAVRTVKVELHLAGWMAPLWKSHYWYAAADGSFLRFDGPANATGSRRITVAYTGEPGGSGGVGPSQPVEN